MNDYNLERSKKAEIERKIRERVKNIIDENYIDIIEQQYEVDIKNINSYKPFLVRFFKKGNNFKNLLSNLKDLKDEYDKVEIKENSFEDFIEQTIYSMEMSKIGAEKDRRNLVKEHVDDFGKFIENKLNLDQ